MDDAIEVLDKLNHKYNSKFYISSDVTYDRPPFENVYQILEKKKIGYLKSMKNMM